MLLSLLSQLLRNGERHPKVSYSRAATFNGKSGDPRLRVVCRFCVLALVACQLWVGRYVIDADGTTYVVVARTWLRGDWLHALNFLQFLAAFAAWEWLT